MTHFVTHVRSRLMDIRFIPSIVPATLINDTARIIETELAARIAKLKEKIDAGNFDSDALDAGRHPHNVPSSF